MAKKAKKAAKRARKTTAKAKVQVVPASATGDEVAGYMLQLQASRTTKLGTRGGIRVS